MRAADGPSFFVTRHAAPLAPHAAVPQSPPCPSLIPHPPSTNTTSALSQPTATFTGATPKSIGSGRHQHQHHQHSQHSTSKQQHHPNLGNQPKPAPTRLFYLDWLKVLVILLVIAFHTIDLYFDYTACAGYYLGLVNAPPGDGSRLPALLFSQLTQVGTGAGAQLPACM